MLPLPYHGPELLYSHTAKLSAEIFSKYSNFDDISIFLPAFPYRTTLKLDNIMVTPSLVKKVITNFDLSKVPGPDCVPVVVLTYCESDLFFYQGFLSQKLTIHWTAGKGRETFYSSLPLPISHEHSDIYL